MKGFFMNKITQLLTISLLFCGAGVANATEDQKDLKPFLKNNEEFCKVVRIYACGQFDKDRENRLSLGNQSNHEENIRLMVIEFSKHRRSDEDFKEACDALNNLYKETLLSCQNQFKASWLSVRPELHRFFKCKPEIK